MGKGSSMLILNGVSLIAFLLVNCEISQNMPIGLYGYEASVSRLWFIILL